MSTDTTTTTEERLAAQEEWGWYCQAHHVVLHTFQRCCRWGSTCSHPDKTTCHVVRLVTDPLAPTGAEGGPS